MCSGLISRSKVRDPALGGSFICRAFVGLRKDDSERNDSLFSWTGSDKYFSEAAGISFPSTVGSKENAGRVFWLLSPRWAQQIW